MNGYFVHAVLILLIDLVVFASEDSLNPHIIYILIDDLGSANVQFHNPQFALTPNLNALLPESLYLNNFYGFKFCSPSRSSLLSGRLPYHVNELNGNMCSPGFGIPLNMTTISEKLSSESNYICHQLGKWHVGMATMKHTPFGRGFTTSLGYFHGGEDHWTQNNTSHEGHHQMCGGIDLWDTTRPAYGINGTYSGYIYSKRSLEIINNWDTNNDKRLFMYLATQNNHKPLQVPQKYINLFNQSWNENQILYAAMMNFEDELIGNVTKALKAKNMWNNTLLLITSDNGGPEGNANNHPFRGGKFSNFEGGIRLMAMVSGGYLPIDRRDKRLNGTIHMADIYATLCSIIGIDPTDHRAEKVGLPPIDSINMWPFIIGETDVSPRNEFLISSENDGGGLIMGDYKILFGTQQPAFWTTYDYPNGTKGQPQNISCGNVTNGGCLFNIKIDPTEHFDIMYEHENEALAEQLRARFIELQNTTFSPNIGPVDEGCCEQIEINLGYWGPWLNETNYTALMYY